MIPLLPIPVTTTRPPQECRHSTARSKSAAIGPAIRSARSRSASASIRTTLEPVDFIGTHSSSLEESFFEIPIPQSRRGIHIIFYEPQKVATDRFKPAWANLSAPLQIVKGLYGSLSRFAGSGFQKKGSARDVSKDV